MPLTKVPATSTDDCDILYEKVTSTNHCGPQDDATKLRTVINCHCKILENHHCKCKLTGSEYPNYAAAELALFLKLQSGPMQCSVGMVLGADDPVGCAVTEKASDPMDCEVLWVKHGKSLAPEKDSGVLQDCEVIWAKPANSSNSGGNQPPKELSAKQNSEPPLLAMAPKPSGLLNELEKESKHDFVSSPTSIHDASACLKQFKRISNRVIDKDQDRTSCNNCTICHSSLASIYDLRLHLCNHVDNTKSNAEIYKKSMDALQELEYRIEIDKRKGRVVCQTCEEAFSRRKELWCHAMIFHSDQRPHQCQLCPKNYTRSGHLKRHEKTHLK